MNRTDSSAPRRLLVISYHFPPDGSIGGQRWAGLSKYLSRLGWEVHVVTASPAGPDAGPANVHRHVCSRRRTLNDVYKAGVERIRQPGVAASAVQDTSATAPVATRPLGPLGALRRVVGSAMYLPDHGRGWVSRAAATARELMREKHFDVVVTSGPPHSAHFAGLLATRANGAQFWMDMRDPWSLTHEMHLPPDGFIRAERYFLRRLEQLAFSRARKVIVNTAEFAAELRNSEPDTDVTWFPNGIDLEQMPDRREELVQHGSISHVGSLYANRSLSTVFAAMSAVLGDRPTIGTGLSLQIAGPLESPHRERMHDEITAAGLQPNVNIHGVLPRAKALDVLCRSHLALVLAQDQPLCVPAKLYESVGLGVPTLVISEENSAAAQEARRIGAMTLEGNDTEGMRALFQDLVDGRIPVSSHAKAPISYQALADRMDGLLRQTVAG